ncbi:membrane protein [Actinoplanes sp. OR16]|uniref:hypothetical protein n=1 Tax=Actinoplanes sp. OR16 TaxID=946334 RepID=UPI000F6D99D0|nr:hypothetical protein [Actinoplanes sp. OR16]BBH71010.1 membrane protein [Actinoplanes sp. OR16]
MDFTTATRHLCAAAYLDEDFRDTVLREVYQQPYRAVAPSYGFTLGPVLGHCLRARTVALIRDGLVVVIVAAAVLTRWLPALLLVAGCSAGWHLWRRSQLRLFRPGSVPSSPAVTARITEIERLQYGNTVIHDFDPYVGAGEVIGNWGVIRSLPGCPPFAADELVAHLGTCLGSLVGGPGADPTGSIPGLTVTDRVFLAGTEARRLNPMISPHEISRIIRNPAPPARHHLACQVVSSGGEVVTTVHVHVAMQARSLYLEAVTTVLLPCHEDYRAADREDQPRWWRVLGEGVALAPGVALRAPARLIRSLPGLRQRFRSAEGVTPGFDHGAILGVREMAATAGPGSLERHPDVRKHQRLIEHRVRAAVRDFLEARGVLCPDLAPAPECV